MKGQQADKPGTQGAPSCPARLPARGARERRGRESRRFGSRHPVQTFKRCGAAAPPSRAVGGGRRRGRSWRVRAGGSAFSSRRRRLPPGGRPSCRRQARPCSRDAPRPDLGPGPRPTAQLAFVRPERAAANAAPRSRDGQHGAQDPARYAGSPAREAGAGVLLSPGDLPGDFRRATPALESSASSGLESLVLSGPHIRVRLEGGFALREGGYRVLVTLGTPILVLPALAR